LARVHASAPWRSLSIPRGQSEQFNRALSMEKPPGA
jgi:hypothetical protein